MRMPAGPKSLTEEDLRRMCQYEHCRKDGSKSEASRYFRILWTKNISLFPKSVQKHCLYFSTFLFQEMWRGMALHFQTSLKNNYPSEWPQSAGFYWLVDYLTLDYCFFDFLLFGFWPSDFWLFDPLTIDSFDSWLLTLWFLILGVPTVASHCGVPLWEATGKEQKQKKRVASRVWEYRSKLLLIDFPMFSYRRQREATGGNMGIPLKIAFDRFPYVFLPEATGGNMGIPLKIAFDQFPYVFLPEATGGNGRQREYCSSADPWPKFPFFSNIRTPNSVRWLGKHHSCFFSVFSRNFQYLFPISV